MRISCSSLNLYLYLSFLFITRYLTSLRPEEQRKIEEQELGKMPSRALTDLTVALLHEVVDPRHHRRSRHGGKRHHRMVAAPESSPPPPPSAAPHRRVSERPPSPSPDRWRTGR
jgi:hypothetical protein